MLENYAALGSSAPPGGQWLELGMTLQSSVVGGRWSGTGPEGRVGRKTARPWGLFPTTAHRLPITGPVALVLLLAACAPSPVRWTSEPGQLVGAGGAGDVLAIRGAPDHAVALTQAIPAPMYGLPSLGAGACLNSVRWARADAHEVAVVWWVARGDSSVMLRLARSHDDGAHWDTLPPADTRDRGVRGCRRPPAALAIDPRSGYTHLAYYLEPEAGAGVFYVHLMDMRRAGSAPGAGDTLAMFHAPVAIVYGESLAEASVAGHGDTVVVAYQNPNDLVPHVELVCSVTAGHSFPRRVDVSGSGSAASAPTVAIDGATIAVGWSEASRLAHDTAGGAQAARREVVRLGVIQ